MKEELILLNRAKALEPEALTEIHDRYFSAVYRFIRLRISNEQTAEDLTSDVFMRFLKAIRDRRAPANSLRGWLFSVANNVLKEQYRRQKRDALTDLDEQLAEANNSVEQQIEQAMTQERVNEAMQTLTEDQQNVLALRFGFAMPIREVAQTMGKSEGSVKMLQARALTALSKRLHGVEVSS